MDFTLPRRQFLASALRAAHDLLIEYDWDAAVDLVSAERDAANRVTNLVTVVLFITISSIFLWVFFKYDITASILQSGFYDPSGSGELSVQSLQRVYFAYIFIHLFFLVTSAKFSRVIYAEVVLVELFRVGGRSQGVTQLHELFKLHPASFYGTIAEAVGQTAGTWKFLPRLIDFCIRYLLLFAFSAMAYVTICRFFWLVITNEVFNGQQRLVALTVLLAMNGLAGIITYWYIFFKRSDLTAAQALTVGPRPAKSRY
ncbi:MAG: hypothetical protein AAF699_22165 [Pseudomonadota bacterium]